MKDERVPYLALFGAVRFVMRSLLHYPETWTVATLAMMRGMRVGKASGRLFMARYEDVLHRPLAEARERLRRARPRGGFRHRGGVADLH